MDYMYHIDIYLSGSGSRFYHSFESNSEILKMSEIKHEMRQKDLTGGFHVLGIYKTIND